MGKKLLAIIEQGGYQNFNELYKNCGFDTIVVHNMRKAMNIVRKELPVVIVAEFNHQSDFRDRTSTLESLLATVQRLQLTHQSHSIRTVVFFEKEFQHQLDKLKAMFADFESIPYPIDVAELKKRIGCVEMVE